MSRFQNKNKIWINNTLKSASEVAKVLEILKDIGVFREKPRRRSRKPKKAKEEEEEAQGDIAGDLASSGFFPSTDATSSIQALKSAVSAQAQTQAAKEQAQIEAGQQVDEMQRINENPFPRKEIVVAGTNYEFGRSAGAIPEDVRNEDISPVASATEGIMEDIDTGGFMAGIARSGVFSEPVRYRGKKESLTASSPRITASSNSEVSSAKFANKTAWIEKAIEMKRPKSTAAAGELELFATKIASEAGIPLQLNRDKDTNLTRYKKILNDIIDDLTEKGFKKLIEEGEMSPPERLTQYL